MAKKVAIIGMAFRFPSTNNAHYWDDLLAGRDLVTEVDAERWALDTYRHPDKTHPGTSYTFAAGSVGDVSQFDAGFFGISPREAALMDPQQRLLLEMSWEALENAGVKPSSLRGSRCGVYIGIASNDYAYRLADDLNTVDSTTATGNTSSIAANRISYVLDLRGPSMAIDTACSSSMVAFHQACQSILSGESIQALAGGVSLHLHPYGFITFSKASMLSKRGRCQVFDAAGDGYVRSEGGGVFLLKDYDQAIADGDRILAVVASSAVNTDGRKSGLTVPSAKVQAELLTHAYAKAGIDPATIDYLEAHGTGTAVGDPIETRAIGEALGKRRAKNKPLLIGSIKSNLGHMEAASGIAGLAKALHCIQHRVIPATIGVKTLNPNIDFNDLNVEVVTENRPLKKSGKIIIGINSFGFGGANAHVILESHEVPKAKAPASPKNTDLPIMLSAKDNAGLKQAASEFAAFLNSQSRTALYDISYNTIFNREAHSHRVVLTGTTPAAIAKSLLAFANDAANNSEVQTGIALTKPAGPAFIYSGNGSQWAGMGKLLLQESALFRTTIREIDALFRLYADFSLEDELAGKHGDDRYELTEIAQPALFALQVGITRMLVQRGITPVAVAGHSVGEVAAAWACGALSLADAVAVIYHRSHAQGTTKGEGQMTAVGCGIADAQALLTSIKSTLAIAGINSSRGITVAGNADQLTQLESALSARGIPYKRLPLDYAFHSPAMDAIETDIKHTLKHVKPVASTIPFYSTVTGQLLDGRKLDAEYWWHNIRKPVLFEQASKQILATGTNIFIEVGPHAVMRGYLNDAMKDSNTEGCVITTLTRQDDAADRVWAAVNSAIIAGACIDWTSLFPVSGKFISLPNYPWQRERHWHPVSAASMGLLSRHKVHPLLGYALQQHVLTWENQLDTLILPSLADHVVGEATVFPGTGFAELMLAAALAWKPSELAEIEELEIRSPLILSDEHAKTIRISIATQDGSVSIVGRDQAGTEPWTTHAVARILSEPGDILLTQIAPDIPTRQPDFDHISHDALTRAAGLNYGAEFQRIAHGWIDGVTAFAVFSPALSASDLAQTHLHPAILDCTFQLIIQLLKDDLALFEGIAFVPVKMGRIAFRQTGAAPHSAQVTLLNRSPHSLTAEFTVFDQNGIAIAVVKEARFRSVRLQKQAADHLRFLDFHATPVPHPLTPITASISFAEIRTALKGVVQQCTQQQLFDRYAFEVEPLLDSLCSGFTVQALQQLADKTGVLTSKAVTTYQQSAPQAAPYFTHLLTMAEQDQAITVSKNGWDIPVSQADSILPIDIWNSLVADYPDYFQIIHSVGRIGLHLPALLTGDINPAKLASDASSLAALTRLALGKLGKQQLTANVRDWITYSLKLLPAGQRLGVLEISASTPLFATDICAQLDFNRSDYTFASPSESALEEVASLQEHYPRFNTSLIDAATTTPAFCQLAIVQLDFSTPEEAIRALKYANSQLIEGGSLLLIGQHPSRWMDFVFGCQAKAIATDTAWHSAQHSAQFWQQQLQTLNFINAEHLDLIPDAHAGPYLLIAQTAAKPISATPSTLARNWLILADKTGYSAQLANLLTKKLSAYDAQVRIARAGDSAHIASLLLDTTAQLDGIIYLAGLNTVTDTPVTLLDLQVERCANAVAIIQACESTQINTTCWLITANVSTDLLSEFEQTSSSTASLPDATLWGFGRTLMNEQSNYAIRMVDLHAPDKLETVANALSQEFMLADKETEVILNAHGARYAPRLRLEPRPVAATVAPLTTPTLRLAFQTPGQLRNLRWEAHPRVPPAAHEIEVEIHATGLNFRDIMYALGMLSDEAIENGFAGPTLGLEFAGVVTNVGMQANGYAVGDRVVGFGPSSFSNRVITQSSAISLIPEAISFAAAATIPSTFLTVYYSLHQLAQLQPGEKLLIHGAAGGVGIAAIQIAKWIGAEIYATAGSDEKRDFLRLAGVEHIYDSRSLAFADEILTDTAGAGVDVVLNSLAGEAINRNFRVLKPFGRFIELGKRDFYENTKIGLRPFRNNISYFGVDADQLMQVRPDFTRKLFAEVMNLFVDGTLHPLPYTVFEANDIVDAFRYMQQAKQIGKIVVTYHQPIHQHHCSIKPAKPQLQLNANATYLVTGGVNGFGLKTAEWLAAKGARHLVLISRRGPQSVETLASIAQLKEQGVQVYATACDVTDYQALSMLLQHIASTMPPLKGIVHAAMVIADGLIRNMDAAQIQRVLAPKVLGALHLHQLTEALALDYFIMFSSATTLFGNPGQGNYVAANATLEALARNRRAAGLAATCVRWGAIDDVGFLARNEEIKDALQGRMGGGALNSAVALDALESILIADRSGLGILELDWKALARFLPSANSAKFSEMAQQDQDNNANTDNGADMQRLLAELTDDELQIAIIAMLKQEVGEILRVAPDKIDANRSIYDMGLDSLMGVELVVALESRFGIRLSVMALSTSPTIAKLAERLITQLKGSDKVEASAVQQQVEQVAAQHGTEMTAESVNNLMRDVQTNSTATNKRMIS
ncbi:type I polyketide synthase [Sulfuriferula nivalis]|uniref:Polyketide synthase n=1 Tax=Sulfuriferula nivalis TaxID=2675298 RepID=A0A809RPI9_9PROT|nr:type I polyketide synthase [Sulfuriferula nivalis]BBP00751.1 polyketide synthase [Sulfuriferula nivalis]